MSRVQEAIARSIREEAGTPEPVDRIEAFKRRVEDELSPVSAADGTLAILQELRDMRDSNLLLVVEAKRANDLTQASMKVLGEALNNLPASFAFAMSDTIVGKVLDLLPEGTSEQVFLTVTSKAMGVSYGEVREALDEVRARRARGEEA